jgi:UDP-glucose 4-epimerase
LISDNLKIIEGDVQRLNLAAIFEDYEYVFHQAALPSVPRSVKDHLASHEANITGTLRVLIAAKNAGIQKVVYASSSSVYGDTAELPKREDMPLNPLSPYAVTKMTGESYCKVFHEIYGLPTISLRYFNVFGPRQDPLSQYAAVIPRFITALLNYAPLQPSGTSMSIIPAPGSAGTAYPLTHTISFRKRKSWGITRE